MDGADIFFGIAVIVFAAIVTIAVNWKQWEGKNIARRSQSSTYTRIYEEAERERARSSVQQRAPGTEVRIGSWTPAEGNPVGYYGRMLWMRISGRV